MRPNPRPERNASARGFTILELLVAVSVLSISLLGLAQLLGVAMQQNHLSRYNTAALEVARGKIERLKAQYNRQLETDIPATDLTDGTHGPETIILSSESEQYGSRTLVVNWQVTSVGNRKDLQIMVDPAGLSGGSGGLWHKTLTIDTSLSP